ncbi:MAG: PAS domain-containing sensor histidine kinase [Candidatus Omnitrophota bacterium]
MKLTHQVRLYIFIILLFVVIGAGVIFNRIFAMNTAHQRLDEEWRELKVVTAFINETEEIIADISQLENNAPLEKIDLATLEQLSQELDEIRQSSVRLEEYEEASHSIAENKDYLKIADNFQILLETLKAPSASIAFKQHVIQQLQSMRLASMNLQGFYIQEIGEAANSAEETKQQILLPMTIMTVVFLLFLTGVATWFIHVINKNTLSLINNEKNQTIGLIAQSLSHEIRNPLSIIKSSASVIKKKLPADSEEYEISGYLIEEADRINGLIDQLLQLNITAKKIIPDEDPAETIQQVIQLLVGVGKKHSVRLLFSNKAAGQRILCDRDQLKQVLINIILNAIQASRPDKEVTITTSANKGIYEIIISDSGRGIDPKIINKVFDPFVTTKENGSGLGLFVAKKIVENNKGHIALTSIPEKGTTVTLLFKKAKENSNVSAGS